MPGPITDIGKMEKWVVTIVLLPKLGDVTPFADRLSEFLQQYMAKEQEEAAKEGAPPAPPAPSQPKIEDRVVTFELKGPVEGRQADRFTAKMEALQDVYEPGKRPGAPGTKLKWPTFPFPIEGQPRTVARGMVHVPTTWPKPKGWNEDAKNGEG